MRCPTRFSRGDGGSFEPIRRYDCPQQTWAYQVPNVFGGSKTYTTPYGSGNYLHVWPFFFETTRRVNWINWLMYAMGASQKLRIFLYSNKLNNIWPDRLIWYGQEWDLSLGGQYPRHEEEISPPLILPGGKVLWAGSIVFNGNGGYIPCHGLNHHFQGKSSPGWPGNCFSLLSAYTYGIPPSQFPSTGTIWDLSGTCWIHFGLGRL